MPMVRIKAILILFIISGFVFIISEIYACEPCVKALNLEESINKSDLIIVGAKVAQGPAASDVGPGGPEWIEVKVTRILKGNIKEDKIKVNSWDGMCPYGIIVDEKYYAMLLAERKSSYADYQYDAVDFGCAVKTLLVENNMVNVEGKGVSIDDFIKNFSLKNNSQPIVDTCEKDKEFSKRVRLEGMCGPRCMDGWERTSYYDNRLLSEELAATFQGRVSTREELTKATVGVYRTSTCDCNHPVSYSIYPEVPGGKEKKVDCRSFYKFINDYNAKCNGCVKTVSAGCC